MDECKHTFLLLLLHFITYYTFSFVLTICSVSISQITVQDILEFEKKYKGSEEEKQDIIQLYVQNQGDMDTITASALCCTQEDEPRICSIIQAAIDSGDVKAFPAFTRESGKKKRSRRKRVRNLLALKPKTPHRSYYIKFCISTHAGLVILLSYNFV